MVGAASVNASTGTRVGTALSLVQCVYVVVKRIFHPSSPTDVPLVVACASLAAVAAASVGLLVWKLKAHEVVR